MAERNFFPGEKECSQLFSLRPFCAMMTRRYEEPAMSLAGTRHVVNAPIRPDRL